MSALSYAERPPAGEPEGLLVLHHGRASDENDLLPLADVFDPERRLHVVTPRGPHELPGWAGHHWYIRRRVGYPDHDTFHQSFRKLAEFHDELWERTGIAPKRTVIGGFSMGAVIAFSMALSAERPVPAGILVFAGFVPTVDGWEPDLAGRAGLRTFIAHGSEDTIVDVGFARRTRELLERGGLDVEYHESGGGHEIAPEHVPAAVDWLAAVL